MKLSALRIAAACGASIVLSAAQVPPPPAPPPPAPLRLDSELAKSFAPHTDTFDYVRREAMIPMRDGVKLYTVILMPRGAKSRADPADAHAVWRRVA